MAQSSKSVNMSGKDKTINSNSVPQKQNASKQQFTLEKCFKIIIAREELILDLENLRNIVKNDLKIAPSDGSEGLCNVLAESLIYYMKHWPCWPRIKDYDAGNVTFVQYYNKFKLFLIHKLNNILLNKNKYIEEIEKEKEETKNVKEVSSVQVQTLSSGVKPDGPYKLVISGPLNTLSNISFVEVNGDVFMKHHFARPWQPLSVMEIINWPEVSVEIKLPGIHFTRTVHPEYERYLENDTNQPHLVESSVPLVKEFPPKAFSHEVYASSYFSAYFHQFIEIAKCIGKVHPRKVVELEALFREFVKDIIEVNLEDGTMATCASVQYNIGKSSYIRNKNFLPSKSSLNFCEILRPMVTMELVRFSAPQDLSTNRITFVNLNYIMKSNAPVQNYFSSLVNTTGITYKCYLCKISFHNIDGLDLLLHHLQQNHSFEHPLACMICHKKFEIKDLANMRWSHACTQQNAAHATNTNT